MSMLFVQLLGGERVTYVAPAFEHAVLTVRKVVTSKEDGCLVVVFEDGDEVSIPSNPIPRVDWESEEPGGPGHFVISWGEDGFKIMVPRDRDPAEAWKSSRSNLDNEIIGESEAA